MAYTMSKTHDDNNVIYDETSILFIKHNRINCSVTNEIIQIARCLNPDFTCNFV